MTFPTPFLDDCPENDKQEMQEMQEIFEAYLLHELSPYYGMVMPSKMIEIYALSAMRAIRDFQALQDMRAMANSRSTEKEVTE